MYRKIKFRAKSLKDKWVFGDLNLNTSVHPHIHKSWLSKENIKQSTIGQFTGLKDRHRTPIYEDDIVEWSDNEYKIHRDVVAYINGGFYPLVNQRIEKGIVLNLKVIGNIFNNHKLLDYEANKQRI